MNLSCLGKSLNPTIFVAKWRRGSGYLVVCERAALPGWVGRAALGPQPLVFFARPCGRSDPLLPHDTRRLDMALRSRSGSVPAGAIGVVVAITFTDHANYNLALADDLALVLSRAELRKGWSVTA
jgi:hypothetical protein